RKMVAPRQGGQSDRPGFEAAALGNLTRVVSASILLAPGRVAIRVLSGTATLAAAPARFALGVVQGVLEDLDGALRRSGETVEMRVPRDTRGMRNGGPEAVTPSVARAPARKRRRTRMAEPAQPAVMPGLPVDSEPEPAAPEKPDARRTATAARK